LGLINAHIDEDTGDAYPDTLGANWSAKPTWANWTHWDANPNATIIYETELDGGQATMLIPVVEVSMSNGDAVVTESHSADGVAWSAYEAIGVMLEARYVRIRVTATGEYPILHEVEATLLSDRKDQTIDNLNTAALAGAYRVGVGDIRLPVAEGEFTVLLNVQVSFNNAGPGWTYEVVDKSATPGPRIRIYNASGNLADATIDAFIRGA